MSAISERPALQVIILGSGGGPLEDNATAFLVRSTSTEWKRGSVLAVDAGTHLAGISRILKSDVTDAKAVNVPLSSGPFKGLKLPFVSVDANAAHITRFLIDTYLITHPHLDHIAGFVINTAGLPGARPKRLAGLPSTIAAFKAHIFNNVIWPNLTDENNGVGLITYMRLVDGGSPALGEGDDKGYVEICEGLSVKALSVSHGHCMENHSHRGSGAVAYPYEYSSDYNRSPPRSNSIQINNGRISKSQEGYGRRDNPGERACVIESSAYFIRDVATGHEVLIFGDVEPDIISLSPRNLQVWTDAAPKIASGSLTAIFIECSYSDSQAQDQLYGHLAPRFLIGELKVLANCVETFRQDKSRRKRKRLNDPQDLNEQSPAPRRSQRVSTTGSRSRLDSNSSLNEGARALDLDGVPPDSISPKTTQRPGQGLADRSLSLSRPGTSGDEYIVMGDAAVNQPPLKGLRVVIIHVKDSLADGEGAGEVVLRQMRAYEEVEGLGCEFVLARVGNSVFV